MRQTQNVLRGDGSMPNVKVILIVLAATRLVGQAGAARASADPAMDSIAEAYVKLVLKVGLYDTTYVDY